MTYEVEVKASIPDSERLSKVLSFVSNWEKGESVVQDDLYLSHPCKDFSKTDEALRIRHTEGKWYLTYKGPKLDNLSKTREEMEMRTSPRVRQILSKLGFREVARVIKRRTVYRKGDTLLCLDEVEGLGNFIELESVSHSLNALPRLLSILSDLGLKGETRSYLELLLARDP